MAASTTYPGCNIPDRQIGNFVVSACNLGSTVAGTGQDSYGHLFQRGNNYGFPSAGTVTTSPILVNNPIRPYWRDVFVTNSTSPYDRANPQSHNLRGGSTSDGPTTIPTTLQEMLNRQ